LRREVWVHWVCRSTRRNNSFILPTQWYVSWAIMTSYAAGGCRLSEGPDRVYSKNVNRARLWLAGSWCRSRLNHGSKDTPQSCWRGFRCPRASLPQLGGYPTHQPEPCSSLHHARTVAAAFKLRVFPARCSFQGHHHVTPLFPQCEFGMTSSTCHYSPKMALPPPIV